MKTYKSKSGKTYTKKQICEAIAYWEKQLNESEKSDAYEISCMNRIADYIVANFGVSRERIYISNSIANGKRLSPLLTTKQLAYVDKPIYAKNAPKDELQ